MDICAIILVKGGSLFSRYMIPEAITELVEIQNVKGGKKITAKIDLDVVVEDLNSSMSGCKHIRFIRAARTDAKVAFITITVWPRLRAALLHSEVPTVHALGGFNNAVMYDDEIAIPNYSMSGTSGWIIKRKDIGRYLVALPELKDSGVIDAVWINHVGWVNLPDECAIRVLDHDPTNEPTPEYYDRARGYNMSSNHQIYKVEYDKGSRVVKSIKNIMDSAQLRSVCYKLHPTERYIAVGKRLPRLEAR